MPETFGDVYRSVLLHVPVATPMLARDWVTDTLRVAIDRRYWCHVRGEDEIIVAASRAVTVGVTLNSTAVTGNFVAADAGRQWRISGPPYTIISVVVGVSATLDRVYGGTTAASQSSTIYDAYATMPQDFGGFIAVLDPQNSWQLFPWMTEDVLNRYDPNRTTTGTPYALASRRYSTLAATLGRVQYELWPYPTSAVRFPFYYYKRPATLADADFFPGVFRERPDVIQHGALAHAAEWPGIPGRPNPYFNLQLARMKREDFMRGLDELAVRDESIYLTWLETVQWLRQVPYAPIDANFLREHEFGP